MKKMDTQVQTPTKQDRLPQIIQQSHKKTLKEEITENFMEILLDKVNQNIQEALKKLQDNKNKEYEKTKSK
jgi:hypothetical protein